MGNETQALEERVRRLEAQVKTLLARRDDDERYRVGYGCDLHRFTEGSSLRLGGIVIPYCQSLLGHSDADALLHAIADAILGAAGVGGVRADDRNGRVDTPAQPCPALAHGTETHNEKFHS